jgi:hypothetical protein
MLNKRKQRFEIHHSKQPFNSYALTVPYSELDARTIHLVCETRRENRRKIIAAMNAHNEKLLLDMENKATDEFGQRLKGHYRYLDAHATDRIPENANTTRWV